jgi:hypothetical protein
MKRVVIFTCLLSMFAGSICRAQFDITAFSGTGPGQTAQGTSNGVGWTMSPTHIGFPPVMDGSYTGFSNPSFFSPAVPATDQIHVGAANFTLTFDQPILSALFYLRADGDSSANIDFGITPILVSGEVNITGTAADPTTNGGVVRYDNINSTTLVHTADIANGLGMAWFVTTVPEPSSIALFGMGGLAMLGRVIRRRRRESLAR